MTPPVNPETVYAWITDVRRRGIALHVEPPHIWVNPADALTAEDRTILYGLRPWVFRVLVGEAKARGRMFCPECSIELQISPDFVPDPTLTYLCIPCLQGELSFARLGQMNDSAFGTAWLCAN